MIDVGFPIERSITDWERRHSDGLVPGRWPYGLDGLDRFGSTRPIALAPPGRMARARRRLGLASRADKSAIGVTWDENAAMRMLATSPHARHYSGVIWLTDSAARGRPVDVAVRALRRCSGLWVLSEAQIDPLRDLLGPGAPDVDYVRFGIDHEFFGQRPYPEQPRVVSVGGDRDRDTETLYRALALVHAARPDAELVVQTSSSLRPPEGVERLSHLPHFELRELYASAGVVAVATRPNLHVSGMTVSLETMATGRPVVATATPGMGDYVTDGETGLLGSTGDAEALARGVLALLDDPARAAGMGSAGRADVEKRFTDTTMTDRIAELIGVR